MTAKPHTTAPSRGRLFVLGGPTATGKTDLAIELAERFDARLVSADAMTVYRFLDIGTAKPSAQVLARHPHACVDVRDPDQRFSVDDFYATVHDLLDAHPRVIAVGGTPFYLRVLVQPLSPLPSADPAVRAVFEAMEDPHALLVRRDPQSAARLHPNDRVRVVRALEVQAITGQTLSALQALPPREPAPADGVAWIDREDVRERVDARLQMMLEQGYVDETRALLAAGWSPALKPMQSFAYRHLVEHVQGALDLDEAIRRTARDTWRLARKQRGWARARGWTPSGRDRVWQLAARTFLD